MNNKHRKVTYCTLKRRKRSRNNFCSNKLMKIVKMKIVKMKISISFSFARACVMKEIKNLLYFDFVGNNFTTVTNTNYSEI